MTNADTARTCPACLGHFETAEDGTMIRHGWNAHNVRHGQNTGWHTGACAGYGAPAFETPEGLAWAKDFHPRLVERAAELKALVPVLEARAEELEAAAKVANVTYATSREFDFDTQREEWRAAREADERNQRQARDDAWAARGAVRQAMAASVEAEVAVRAHAKAIENWVEGAAPTVADKVVHASFVSCDAASGEKKPRTSHIDSEVTCPHCQAALKAERQAKRDNRVLDRLFNAIYEAVGVGGLTETKLTNHIRSIGEGKKIRFMPFPVGAPQDAARSVGPYFHNATEEQRMVRAAWFRRLARDKAKAKAAKKKSAA